MRALLKVTCLLEIVRMALLPARFEDDDDKSDMLDHYCEILELSPTCNAQIHTDREMWPPHKIWASFSSFFWLACEIMPQVFLCGQFYSAICLSLRVKLRLKEQEPWKTVFHSSYFLSFRDTTTRARASSRTSFSDFRNLCVWKSCSIRWKDSSFLKFSENI